MAEHVVRFHVERRGLFLTKFVLGEHPEYWGPFDLLNILTFFSACDTQETANKLPSGCRVRVSIDGCWPSPDARRPRKPLLPGPVLNLAPCWRGATSWGW